MKGQDNFTKRLKELVEEKGYTQMKFAELLGVSQTAISRWLNGKRSPDYETILLLCAYLDETPNELLGYDEKEICKYRKELIEERIRSDREFQILCEQTEKRLTQEGKSKEEITQAAERLFGEKYKEFCADYRLPE